MSFIITLNSIIFMVCSGFIWLPISIGFFIWKSITVSIHRAFLENEYIFDIFWDFSYRHPIIALIISAIVIGLASKRTLLD